MEDIAFEQVRLRLVKARRLSYLVGLAGVGVAYLLIVIFYPAFNPEPFPFWIPLILSAVIGGGFAYIGHWILASIFVPGISTMVHGETIKYEGLTKETTIEVAQTGNLNLDIEVRSYAEARSMAHYFLSVIIFIVLIVGAYIIWS